ncbi:RTA1 like protein-domain-containing protein [Tricladium varicosporioides]|nr:RTA1 like protein-domain-containing protein [Hymenoscyphus varicosporioides]
MDCSKITPECPVEATVYGYYPSLGGNIIFAVIFAICAIGQVVLGIKYHLRFYTIVVGLGCVGETVGYIGRVMLHSNPWSNGGFIIQVLLLIVSPSLLAAGLYLTLKHLVLHYGPQYSRLRPKFYTWLFVTCDAIGFLTQLVGGGVQASASNGSGSKKTRDVGNVIMVIGITFQAVVMGVCGLVALDFTYSLYKHRAERDPSQRVPSPKGPKAFRFYMACTITAFVTIFVRCIYRIPEMAGGWGNKLMRNEVEFMILDGAMVAIAAILMTIGFPGAYFPSISSRAATGNRKTNSTDDELQLSNIPSPSLQRTTAVQK